MKSYNTIEVIHSYLVAFIIRMAKTIRMIIGQLSARISTTLLTGFDRLQGMELDYMTGQIPTASIFLAYIPCT